MKLFHLKVIKGQGQKRVTRSEQLVVGGEHTDTVHLFIVEVEVRDVLVLLQLAVQCMPLAPVLGREQLSAEDTAKLWPKVAEVRVVVPN